MSLCDVCGHAGRGGCRNHQCEREILSLQVCSEQHVTVSWSVRGGSQELSM